MSCPTWSGFDLVGRKVCPDSFYTKSAGCNSAEDRVVVENNVSRPQYMEYITLNAGAQAASKATCMATALAKAALSPLKRISFAPLADATKRSVLVSCQQARHKFARDSHFTKKDLIQAVLRSAEG
jgi:hypothetical protein